MTVDDLDDFHTLRNQIEVMKWTSTGKLDVDTDFTLKWMERQMPPNDTKNFGFAIEELSNPGRVIGTIGVPFPDPPECGYMFRKEFWGKGYATETLQAWLQRYWALPRKEVEVEEEVPGYKRSADENGVMREVLRAMTVLDNEGSKRVLEKCGFKYLTKELEEDTHFPGEGKTIWAVHYVMERPIS